MSIGTEAAYNFVGVTKTTELQQFLDRAVSPNEVF